jgi:hypothetical protein
MGKFPSYKEIEYFSAKRKYNAFQPIGEEREGCIKKP